MRGVIALAFLAGVLVAQITGPDAKGTIRGVVRDSNGLPVSGISVEAVLGVEPRTIVMGHISGRMGGRTVNSATDDGGKYALTGLDAGTYYLRTERDPDSGAYRPVKLAAGQEVALDFVVPANAVISGRVLGPDGDPEVDAFVWLLKPEYERGVLKQIVVGPKITNKDGAYSFDSGLEPNRRYYLFADRDQPKGLNTDQREPIEVPTYYPSASRMDSATPVILRPGETRQKVDIKIATAPYYCFGGKIEGLPDFEIRESSLAGTRLVRLRGSAGEHGRYHVCGLSPGEYRLSTEQAFTEFTVLSSDLEHVDLSRELAHLRVKVEWDDPSSAPTVPKLTGRADATLRKLAASLGMADPSDDDLVHLATRLLWPDPNDTALIEALGRNQDDNFDGEMGYLRGLLSVSDSLLHVTLTSAAGNGVQTISLAVPSDVLLRDGLAPGDYALDFVVLGQVTTYPKEMTYNDAKLSDRTLRIAPGGSGTLHLVMGTDLSTVAVSIKDALENPVTGAAVVLIPESVTTTPALARLAVHGNADQNGKYTSPPLAPGKYRALATTQAVRWDVPEDLEKVLLAMYQAKDIDVAPKSAAQITVEPVVIY
jgi:hypothetical protein